MVRYGLKMNLQTIAVLLLFRIDLLIVKYFRGSAETGVYSIASQVALLLMLLPGVISTLLLPHLAAETEQRSTLACLVTRHTTFLMFILCVAAVPMSFVLPLFYGRDFAEAVLLTLILLPGVFLVSIGTVLSLYFSGAGLPLPVPLFWLATLCFNIAVNLVAVPKLGARGAAISSSVSYAVIFILITLYFRYRTGNQFRDMFLIRGSELRRLLSPQRLFARQ
jgi:O-antigen/teichoic acid export membrane protein